MCRGKGRLGAREERGPECVNVVRKEMYRLRSAEAIFRVLKDKKDLKKRLGKNHLCSKRKTWRMYLLSGQVKTVTHVVGIFFLKCCLQFKKRECMKKNNSRRRIQ